MGRRVLTRVLNVHEHGFAISSFCQASHLSTLRGYQEAAQARFAQHTTNESLGNASCCGGSRQQRVINIELATVAD